MPKAGDTYIVEIEPSHIDWGNEPRNPTNRAKIKGESYVKIPVDYARKYDCKASSKIVHFSPESRPLFYQLIC